MKARSAWDEVGARKSTIPARSPDLNPMKTIFNSVKQMLHQDALDQQITHDDLAAFLARLKTTLKSITFDVMDRTILSMIKRIKKNLKGNRQIIKY